MSEVAEVAEVRWGYTMDDIDRLTRRVFNKTRYSYLFDHNDHVGAAWFGIVEHLFSAVEQPSDYDLIKAGTDRVGAESVANRSFYGIADGAVVAPRLAMYWGLSTKRTRGRQTGGSDGFTDRIAEREALPQVLAVLNTDLYEAIVTLAAYGNMSEAAKALGMEYRVFNKRIARARAKIIQAWFAPEHPPQLGNGYGDTCRAGHPRAEHSFRNERGVNVCRLCKQAAHRRYYYRNREPLEQVACPECSTEITAKNLRRHLCAMHGLTEVEAKARAREARAELAEAG
ncbi:MAG TPA: hypothetical protein VNS81_06595 [Nocardioides sp.]|nr:hypothetical protein [Nocardioides sp.]